MREIKFRGKRVDNGEWVYGYYFEGFTGIPYILVLHDHILGMTEFYEVDPSTFGQYTGSKDKNGNEIYEGDIVLYGDKKGVVIYHGCEFSLKITGEEYIQHGLLVEKSFRPFEVFEVIGNIYENPELFGESYEN